MSDIGLILMAAGSARRMGGPHKLLQPWRGKPIITHAADAARGSGLAPCILVTGREAEAVAAAAGPGFIIVHNPRFATGFGTSLSAGVQALLQAAPSIRGAVVALADMPLVTSAMLQRLAAAFDDSGGEAVIRAAHKGEAGNPVVLPARLFAAMAQLDGDEGARRLIKAAGLATVQVECGAGALIDIDTPEALAALDGFQEDAR